MRVEAEALGGGDPNKTQVLFEKILTGWLIWKDSEESDRVANVHEYVIKKILAQEKEREASGRRHSGSPARQEGAGQ